MRTRTILLVTKDRRLSRSRLALLGSDDYTIDLAHSDHQTMMALLGKHYDLIVIDMESESGQIPLDEKLARSFNPVPVLKLSDTPSFYSCSVGTEPEIVLRAVRLLLDGPEVVFRHGHHMAS